MVPDDAAEAEGQDRQGRDAAGSRTSNEDVQLLGVQRYRLTLVLLNLPAYLYPCRYEGGLPTLRVSVLRLRRGLCGQRAHHVGDNTSLR